MRTTRGVRLDVTVLEHLGSAVMTVAITSLFWIATVMVLAPLLARLSRGYVSEVVIMLVLGAVIGPSVLGLASTAEGVWLIREIGLGLLFLLAGTELDVATMRGSVGRNAWLTWVICLLFGLGLAWLALPTPSLDSALVLALAVTSTALGTLLPILKDRQELDTTLGRAVMAHGAVGELGPILVMALLLGARSTWMSALVLLLFLVGALVVALVPSRMVRIPWLRRAIILGRNSAQLPMRIIFWVLLGLMLLASILELDVVLGAFAAGLLLKAVQPAGTEYLEQRLQTVAFSFFVPVFFVTSGMNIDVTVIAQHPLMLLLIVAMILLVRGGIVWLRERFTPTGSGLTTPRDRLRLALYSATGLPIIVAVTELATANELLSQGVASLLVAAGAMTVLLFPLLAKLINQAGAKAETAAP